MEKSKVKNEIFVLTGGSVIFVDYPEQIKHFEKIT
jgi:hypothetical protein